MIKDMKGCWFKKNMRGKRPPAGARCKTSDKEFLDVNLKQPGGRMLVREIKKGSHPHSNLVFRVSGIIIDWSVLDSRSKCHPCLFTNRKSMRSKDKKNFGSSSSDDQIEEDRQTHSGCSDKTFYNSVTFTQAGSVTLPALSPSPPSLTQCIL